MIPRFKSILSKIALFKDRLGFPHINLDPGLLYKDLSKIIEIKEFEEEVELSDQDLNTEMLYIIIRGEVTLNQRIVIQEWQRLNMENRNQFHKSQESDDFMSSYSSLNSSDNNNHFEIDKKQPIINHGDTVAFRNQKISPGKHFDMNELIEKYNKNFTVQVAKNSLLLEINKASLDKVITKTLESVQHTLLVFLSNISFLKTWSSTGLK